LKEALSLDPSGDEKMAELYALDTKFKSLIFLKDLNCSKMVLLYILQE